MSDEKAKTKQKFIFNCTKCGVCCEDRGPIPITFTDMKLWASNNVVQNFLPHLKIYQNSLGFVDLILSPTNFEPDIPNEDEKDKEKDDSDKKLKCPMFNLEKRECMVYNYRPLSCRTYPLEFNGSFQVIDGCPGVGEGEMSKEERLEMRDNAKKMYEELITARVSIPILTQVVQKDFYMNMMKQQAEMMKNMDPEDLKKLDDILGKGKEK